MSGNLEKVIVYSSFESPRLSYVLNYVFRERMGCDLIHTTDLNEFEKSSLFKVNYDSKVSEHADWHIIPHTLLKEEDIRKQQVSIQRWKHSFVIFYNQPKGKIPFDLFSAIFYFISRYEEYLPYVKDRHQRFPASASLAGRYAFLHSPVVDEWLVHCAALLPFETQLQKQQASWQMTVDIDMIWQYKHKKIGRLLASAGKDLLKGKIRSIANVINSRTQKFVDPFDCFDFIEKQVGDSVQYFVLTAEQTPFDRNTSPQKKEFQEKIQSLHRKVNMGLHPSYFSNEQHSIQKELSVLEEIIGKKITKSRQHFIKLQLPGTYHQLLAAGIQEDFTMGYPEVNGFRAGTSRPFFWFDLSKNKATDLLVHPFVYMDATQLFYGKADSRAQIMEVEMLAQKIQASKGVFTGIWHNYIIGDQIHYPRQRKIFETSIKTLKKIFS